MSGFVNYPVKMADNRIVCNPSVDQDILSKALNSSGVLLNDAEFNKTTNVVQNVSQPTLVRVIQGPIRTQSTPQITVIKQPQTTPVYQPRMVQVQGIRTVSPTIIHNNPVLTLSAQASPTSNVFVVRNATNSPKPVTISHVQSAPSLLTSQQAVQASDKKPRIIQVVPKSTEEGVEEDEGEILHQAETYSIYKPAKIRRGVPHPDVVVESASLASVLPPDPDFQMRLPSEVTDEGFLSAIQYETVLYACQRHEQLLPDGNRAGFLVGDGAGVGKGRTIAGIIYENYLRKRKRVLWLSVSNDLKLDAERDLRDIGAGHIPVYSLNKLKYKKISSSENGSIKKGVIFATYTSLVSKSSSGSQEGRYNSRYKQLLHWLKDKEGLIVFDECHRAKNLRPAGTGKSTKTGQAVQGLQTYLNDARVVYASATGATEPAHMAYMVRLGLWGEGTPFIEFPEFISTVNARGVAAMELVAMDMKLRGLYIARQLSFHGVTFHVQDVTPPEKFLEVYDKACVLWHKVIRYFQTALSKLPNISKNVMSQVWSAQQRFFRSLCISAKLGRCAEMVEVALRSGKCVVIGLQSTGESQLRDELEDGGNIDQDQLSSATKHILESLVRKHFPTGSGFSSFVRDNSPSPSPSPPPPKRKKYESEESSSDSEDSGSSSDENPFLASDDEDPWLREKKSKKKKKIPKVSSFSNGDLDEEEEAKNRIVESIICSDKLKEFSDGNTSDEDLKLKKMKIELLQETEELGKILPGNPLDDLIDRLGGPDRVAEMTGRKMRMVCNDMGKYDIEQRRCDNQPIEMTNIMEKGAFMDGEKKIAIISDAASSGISLHADRRAINQSKRVHITLELPWSADRAIQQFGRTHRSNQVSAPEYHFLISTFGGERRFAATVAKRLESLGALTHGDRRATETRDLSQFNIDTKYGRLALERMLKGLTNCGPLLPPPPEAGQDFVSRAQKALKAVNILESYNDVYNIERDSLTIGKFLNRILCIPTRLQNAIFKYFTDYLNTAIKEAKKYGSFDEGILDLTSGAELAKEININTFESSIGSSKTQLALYQLAIDRGMSYADALHQWRQHDGESDGFYRAKTGSTKLIQLAIKYSKPQAAGYFRYKKNNKQDEQLYKVYTPHTGRQPRLTTFDKLQKKFEKIETGEAGALWKKQHTFTESECLHKYLKKACHSENCTLGVRNQIYHILAGSLLSVWDKVERILQMTRSGVHERMQIVRVSTEDGRRIVGVVIPKNSVQLLEEVFSGKKDLYSGSAPSNTTNTFQQVNAEKSNFKRMFATTKDIRPITTLQPDKEQHTEKEKSPTESSEIKEEKREETAPEPEPIVLPDEDETFPEESYEDMPTF